MCDKATVVVAVEDGGGHVQYSIDASRKWMEHRGCPMEMSSEEDLHVLTCTPPVSSAVLLSVNLLFSPMQLPMAVAL